MATTNNPFSVLSDNNVLGYRAVMWCAVLWLTLAGAEIVPSIIANWANNNLMPLGQLVPMLLVYLYWFLMSLLIRIWLWRFPLNRLRHWIYHSSVAIGIACLYLFWTAWSVSISGLPENAGLSFAELYLQQFVRYFAGELIIYAVVVVAWTLTIRQTGKPSAPRTLSIKQNGTIRKLEVDRIVWLESMENYVVVHTTKEKLIHRRTLISTMEVLGPGFIRVHRSTVVNKKFIQQINSASHEILMTTGDIIGVGRRRLCEVTQQYLTTEIPS